MVVGTSLLRRESGAQARAVESRFQGDGIQNRFSEVVDLTGNAVQLFYNGSTCLTLGIRGVEIRFQRFKEFNDIEQCRSIDDPGKAISSTGTTHGLDKS